MNKYRLRILISLFILLIIGLIMVYSSSNVWSLYKYNDAFKYIKQQALFAFIGLLIVFILNKISIDKIINKTNLLLIISIILLILVLIPGIGSIRNGSRSWFCIGPFGIQPSELTKLILIIFTSKYLSRNDKYIKSIKEGLIPIFIIIIISFILIMLEPDFGSAMVIMLTLIGIIFISGPKKSLFVTTGLLGLIAITILIIIAPYRIARITSYLNPWSDPLGSGFQIIQSLYAIAPSGFLGTGFNKSIQKNFYLPEPQTDFIFSILSEEFGFIGCFVTITTYIVLFYNSIKLSLEQSDLLKKYLIFGLSFGLILQTVLNLSVVTGLIPTTGVTLPFISYGGSSLLISMTSIGLILSASKNE